MTPEQTLFHAIENRNLRDVQRIVHESPTLVSAPLNRFGHTPLFLAASRADYDLARILTDSNRSDNIILGKRDIFGRDALDVALELQLDEIVNILEPIYRKEFEAANKECEAQTAIVNSTIQIIVEGIKGVLAAISYNHKYAYIAYAAILIGVISIVLLTTLHNQQGDQIIVEDNSEETDRRYWAFGDPNSESSRNLNAISIELMTYGLRLESLSRVQRLNFSSTNSSVDSCIISARYSGQAISRELLGDFDSSQWIVDGSGDATNVIIPPELDARLLGAAQELCLHN